MSHLDQVRAEIKAWERDFASRHGRDPSVQDIRDQPDIAEKYKLYKKLSKSLPKARAPSPPPPRFNPFSPAKKPASLRQAPRPNPFATPTKKRTVSPSPGPPNPTTSSHALPVSATAVSRARKRLRGEPVSPSPSKPKRQRIRSQPHSFSRREHDSSNSEHELNQELPHCDFSSSCVADSPVKAPAGGKSFKLLFDDALPAISLPKMPLGSSVAQPDPPSDTSVARTFADFPAAISHKSHHNFASKSRGPVHRISYTRNNDFPSEGHAHKPSFTTAVSGASQLRASMKRALDSENLAHESTQHSVPQSQYPLIPPSPPPQDPTNRDHVKGKTKAIASRKKLRVEDEGSDDSLGNVTLKVATVDRSNRSHRNADDLDWDPLLHLGTRNHESTATQQIDANHHVSGTFSVDLPEKFRRVLAISPSRIQNRTEERVVRGLLYGDRVGNYDPSRGGAIWDAGEAGDTAYGDVDTEDDWEGEPVPWDVGEL